MKAVILAGGFATRLRPLSCSRPKTLFPIVNKPLLEWIFMHLANNGIDQAILAVNALTQFYIRQQHPKKHGLKVMFSVDPPRTPLGTAGPVKKAEKLVGRNEPFFVLNGDIFADINYKELAETHKKCSALATIALCRVDDPCRYGVAELENGNRIKRFIEKPAKDEAPSNFVNAGAYMLSPQVFDYIPAHKAVSMEREVFPMLAEEGKLFGYHVNGVWMDIGKPEEYLETNKIILDAVAKKYKTKKTDQLEVKNPVAFDKQVSVGAGSVIGPYAILGEKVTVGKNVRISNSVIFPHVRVEDSASVDGAIIGEGARIGKNVKISHECVIGDHTKIRDNLEISGKVCPGKEVAENVLKHRFHC